jgi:lipopolysaccharide/colanic/teichoic acid biosynthesis glycosyltransferase
MEYSILILGEKYDFNTNEILELNRKFITINKIIYKKKNPCQVINNVKELLEKNAFTLIVLNTKAKVDNEIIKYLTNLKFQVLNSKFDIISIEHFLEKYLYKCYIPEDNTDLHYLDNIQGYNLSQKIQKIIVDIIGVIGLFIIFLFIKPFINRKIQKQSPGKLYFKQLRVGFKNKKFSCIKFRTMYEHDSDNNTQIATKKDKRIFPFGSTMRKFRIDEIPQLFNILKGDLHLIGPRAEWDKLVQEYEETIPYYNHRHMVKPGITGWAQVMFIDGKNKRDTKQKLMYDLYYIKHWNLILEIKIILKTILIVLKKRGI